MSFTIVVSGLFGCLGGLIGTYLQSRMRRPPTERPPSKPPPYTPGSQNIGRGPAITVVHCYGDDPEIDLSDYLGGPPVPPASPWPESEIKEP